MSGHVVLVGAGPGDPGLLTAAALEAIASAEVVLHDKLIPEAISWPAGALVVDVGKRGDGSGSTPQEEIHRLLIEHASAGKRVVRVKGGDPFVFGRGGEEAQVLRAAGISFSVVPGVTAGVAAPAYAGIPVTHRDHASAVAFVTGHEDPEKPETAIDWPALAAFPGTLVFYMGVRQLPRIATQLLGAGRADEPVAVVERGTFGDQRCVTAPLSRIAAAASEAGVRPPSITVVGPVVGLRDELSWFDDRPLAGRTVAVTRALAGAGELAGRLQALGARVVVATSIRIEPLDFAWPSLDGYDLVVFTSASTVERVFTAVRDARALAGPLVAAIGPGTAAALRAHGVEADVLPERSMAEGLLDAIPPGLARVLLPRAREAREVLPEGLRERGVAVDVLPVYETVAAPLDERALAAAAAADLVTFASASAVRAYVAAVGTPPAGQRTASIGPITSEAMRAAGLEPSVEAATHDLDGLVEAVVTALSTG